MRNFARGQNKTVPSKALLEQLFDAAEAAGMVCPACRVEMHWFKKTPGDRRVVSLQHDRDGGFRLICLRCNKRHQGFPGDTFYLYAAAVPELKWCRFCEQAKPRDQFNPNSAYCRPCALEYSRGYQREGLTAAEQIARKRARPAA